jgi:hypothetical protein
MHSVDERSVRTLPIDPQPRRNLEVPPVISTQQHQGVSSVRVPEQRTPQVNNLFASLDFKLTQ